MLKITTTETRPEQFVTVTPKTSVRLHGVNRNHRSGGYEYDRTFVIGDYAEFDSYNLRYFGKIVRIGPKTVTIDEDRGAPLGKATRRLNLAIFALRNYDFELEAIRAYNHEEGMYI